MKTSAADTENAGTTDAPVGRGRHFGLWTLTFLVIANMVGAGVFTTSGFTLNDVGTPAMVVLAWIVGGLIALAGAASYGQLARAMPESGGEYLFLSRALHPMAGFVAGWVSLIAGFTGAIAYAATALESYVLPAAARPDWFPGDVVAILAVILGGLCHGLQVRAGAVLQNVAVALKLGLLASFLIVAVFAFPSYQGGAAPPDAPAGWALLVAFASSLVWISLSYSGFNAAVYVAGEAQDSRRTVPRALLLATAITMLLYVLLNAVFVYAPPREAVAGVPDVAARAAAALGGPWLALLVRIIVSTALLTSVTSMMMAAPRVYAKMADDGLLPGFLGSRGGAPRMAIIAQVVLAIVIIRVTTLQGLLSYLGLTLSLSAACSVCCLFLARVRETSPWHVSLAPPVFYVACTLLAASIMVYHDPGKLLAAALTFLLGAVVYLVVGRRKRDQPQQQRQHEQVAQ